MAYAPSGFDQWTKDEVKAWINSWTNFGVSQSTISHFITQVDNFNITGGTLLYLTKEDFKEFGLSHQDACLFMQRLDWLREHPLKPNQKQSASKPELQPTANDENEEEFMNDSNEIMEGYLDTTGQEVYICLQRGDNYTKMALDPSHTVAQLKEKYTQQTHETGDVVLLFMGQVLEDKNTLNHYKIGCTNISTIFVAERINSSTSSNGKPKGECVGILFINKEDQSEHILYVDNSITIKELKQIYKNYLLNDYTQKKKQQQAQILYSQSATFECSGRTFGNDLVLKDLGMESGALQYIFASFGDITEDEKDNDETYVSNIYQMSPKEHKHAVSVKQQFEKAVKAATFQKSVQETTKTFSAASKHDLDQMKSYHQMEDIVKEQTSADTKKATDFTKKVLNTPPTGELGADINTTLHVISNIFKSAGDECVFYDSRQGVKLKAGDSGCAMHEAFMEDKPFVLRLKTLSGLYGVSDEEVKSDASKLIEMQCAIENGVQHPTLCHVQSKLSHALGVNKDRINIIGVFSGSDCFKYTVSNLTYRDKTRMIQSDPTGRLGREFAQFQQLKIHPLLFRPAFDVASFDKRGDKSFVSSSGKFQIGPANMKKQYTQPTGWTRYGLKVLGKYADDKWLHPFNDANNWWRAFHGTKNAQRYGVNPANAMANVHKNGFLPAKVAAYGPGVYCSPQPPTAEGYAKQIAMNIRDNKGQQQQKNFRFMLQVAVKPGANTLTPASNNNIWSVQKAQDIRAYGILIKEV